MQSSLLRQCSSCFTFSTPQWRTQEGVQLCNACFLYQRLKRIPRPAKLMKRQMNKSMIQMCVNCFCTTTSLWRRDDEGNLNCNPCRLYFKVHKQPRNYALLKRRSSIKNVYPASPDSICSSLAYTEVPTRFYEPRPKSNIWKIIFDGSRQRTQERKLPPFLDSRRKAFLLSVKEMLPLPNITGAQTNLHGFAQVAIMTHL